MVDVLATAALVAARPWCGPVAWCVHQRLLASRLSRRRIVSVVHVGGVNVSPDETVTGSSTDGFKAAAEDAVKRWEEGRGGAPEEVTRLRVEMHVRVGSNSVHDYIAVLRPVD